jgi:hypothetical protein
MMASGEIRLSGTTMRRMPVLAQSQIDTGPSADGAPAIVATAQSGGATIWNDPNDATAGIIAVGYQGSYHDQVVAQITNDMLAAGIQVVNSPTICLTGGLCARPDIFAKDPKQGGLMIIEVKTGQNPTFTPGQMAVYPHLDAPGSLYSASPQLSAFGIAPGQSLPAILGLLWLQTNGSTQPQIYPLSAFFP